MKAVAPAKVILSGEHAVLFGAPALAMAVSCYAEVEVAPYRPARLLIDLLDLQQQVELPFLKITERVMACQQRHRDFLAGQCPVDQVAAPEDLVMAALLAAAGGVDLSGLASEGIAVRVRSAIPLGAGMGSSAAVIAATLRAASELMHNPLSSEQRISAVTAIEQLQHGRSSGLDPALCCAGGLLRFQHGSHAVVDASLCGDWLLVNSGMPQSSTGVCVAQVKRDYADSAIWQRFATVTDNLQQALRQGDRQQVGAVLRDNHRLLVELGVVPAPVAAWIAELEQLGCSAKICGAGAVAGDAGGMVLVYHPLAVPQLALPQGYLPIQMEFDFDGARLRS